MKNKANALTVVKGVKKFGGKDGKRGSAADFLKQRLGQKVRELRPDGDVDECRQESKVPKHPDLAAMQAEAARRSSEFDRGNSGDPAENEMQDAAQVNPDREVENTRKRFYAECKKVIVAADVVIEVLDARDPASCRSEELEKEVVHAGKRLVLLINKIDLVPREAVEAWLKHLKRSHPVVAFKAMHGECKRSKHAMVSSVKASEGLLRSTHAVVGADDLMQLLKNYARTGVSSVQKAHINVGIVGYPNTGKSSVINSLKRHNAVEAGGRAGVTKVMQEVQLDSKVTLIDSPGVVFEGESGDAAVILRNVVAVDRLADPVGVVEALVAKAPRQALLQYYGLERDFSSVSDFLVHVARARGKLKRGSGLDLPSAAKSVITDWTTGKLRYYVMPPEGSEAMAMAAEEETAQIVQNLAPALDIDALLSGKGCVPTVLGAPSRRAAADSDICMAEMDM